MQPLAIAMRLAIVSIIMLAGCRIYLDSPDAGPDASGASICDQAADHSDLTWIQDSIFSPSCALSSACHKGTAAGAGHLNLETGNARANLIGVATQSISGYSRVVAGDPMNSYLMISLHDANAPGTEPANGWMPQTGSELCQPAKDAIWRWIEGGAQP